ISPHDHNTLYVTSQHVHRTTNAGQTWEVISPDLSMNDKSKQTISGGLTPDNIAVEYANVIYAFDESPVQQGLFWAGTNDGLVHISQDRGGSWNDLTANIPDLPPLGVVRNIDASKWDAGKAYLTVDLHQVGDFKPYVYKTDDYGQSWDLITTGIADSTMLNYARCIREDPIRPGLLYLGTENALYYSLDDGEKWQSLMTNLPHSPMYWLDIPEHFNDLVVGTYGRGIWILDDISPLQQMNPEIFDSPAHLFHPKPVYRLRPVTMIMQFFPEASFGKDPPYGASIHYWLANDNDSVKIHITDDAGDTLRTIKHKGKSGINRVWWNLRTDSTDQIVMRTKPKYADWFPLDKQRTRKSIIAPFRVLVPPGTYQIRMTIDDEDLERTIQVLKDPNSEGTANDISQQISLMMKLYNDMNTLADMINEMESIRRQLLDLSATIKEKTEYTEVHAAIAPLDSVLLALEGKMIQLKFTGTGQDQVRYPAMLAERIDYLASTVSIGDFPPADSHLEVYALLKDRLSAYQQEFQHILDGPLEEFLGLLDNNEVKPIISNYEP
ncbi:MAG: hypothetical protein OEQ53_09365, partial [Saprospiraceae bacterium]|nr:hypothetical protein [Saprospiraceae bacterium]